MNKWFATCAAAASLALCLPGLASAHRNASCKPEMLRGQYVFSATGFTRLNLDAPWVPKAIVEALHINGDGTLTTPSVTLANPFGNTGLVIDRVGSPGVYTLNDDCTGSLQFADGVVFKIYAAPRGDELWMIQTAGPGGSLNVFQGSAKRVR